MRRRYFVSHADDAKPGCPLWCVYGPGDEPIKTFGSWLEVEALHEEGRHSSETNAQAQAFAAALNAGGNRRERALRRVGR